MRFDYADFKAAWRAGCRRYGVDPAAGPSTYSIANLRAEQRKHQPRIYAPVTVDTVDRLNAWLRAEQDRLLVASAQDAALIRQVVALLRDAALTAARMAGVPSGGQALIEAVDSDAVSWVEFEDLWHEVRREMAGELTPRQRAMLPTLADLKAGVKALEDELAAMAVQGLTA